MGKSARGRNATRIDDRFYVCKPTPAMRAITGLKNEGRTWREVAEVLQEKDPSITHQLLWKVCKGYIDSHKVNVALGFARKVEKIPVCEECGKVHVRRKSCGHSRTRFRFALDCADRDTQQAVIDLFDAAGVPRKEIAENLAGLEEERREEFIALLKGELL